MKSIAFDDLSTPQQVALMDIVSRNGLFRTATGYDGAMTHTTGSMEALARRGLCRILTKTGDMGAVVPSKRGRQLILDHFNDTPLLVDASRQARAKGLKPRALRTR